MVYNNNAQKETLSDRFAILARFGGVLFHINDFANLWGIYDKHNLHTTLKRYTDKNLLFRVYRGFYAIKPVDQIPTFILGIKALHRFSYISTETILSREGVMTQSFEAITLVSSISKRFTIGSNRFIARRLSEKFLLNTYGVSYENGTLIANTERAIADMLYFNPKAHFDGASFIDWGKVHEVQKKVGYPLTPKRFY
jgi:hypothetical protein